MKNFLTILTIIIASSIGIFLGTEVFKSNLPSPTPVQVVVNETKQTNTQVKENIGIPKRIIINKIGVNANVESVGKDKQGRMDVPRNANNTAWYNLGSKPGEVGNSVIAGHLDKIDGSAAIFYNLTSLSIGDNIQIIDQNNKTLNFKVIDKKVYSNQSFPVETVFGRSNTKRLNLITCDGIFNTNVQSYSHRVVVFSQIVD